MKAEIAYFHCGDQLRKTLAVEIGDTLAQLKERRGPPKVAHRAGVIGAACRKTYRISAALGPLKK
jgi:hypothetical protein